MRKATPAVVIVAALAVLAAACSTTGDDRIVVGAVYPLSGSQGPGGLAEFRGVQLAADLVNQDGGVNGRRIDLRRIDVSGSDAAAAAVAQLDAQGARFVLGSYGSTISLPAAEAATRREMLFWETGAVGEMTGQGAGDLVFRVAPSGAVLGRAAVSFVVDRLATMLDRDPATLSFAVAMVDDVYGSAVARGALDEIRERGLPLAGRFPYDPLALHPRALVGRIAASSPDVLFVTAYLEDGIALRRETVRQDVPLVASIGTSSSYCHPEFGARLGRDALGLFASDKPAAAAIDPAGLLPQARSLLARAGREYRARFGEDLSAPALAGFSAAWALFHDVMPRAPSITPEAVARAALGARIPSGGLPNGSGLAFGAPGSPDAGTNLRAASVIWEWVGVAERAVVWPPQYATADIQPIPLS